MRLAARAITLIAAITLLTAWSDSKPQPDPMPYLVQQAKAKGGEATRDGPALPASSPGSGKLSIAGISPGDTLGDITTRLGRPITQERMEGFIVLRVSYDQLSFDLDEDGLVANAETTNPKHCFNGWLCPGASLSSVRSRLEGVTQPPSAGAPLVAYADGDGCWLEIAAPSQTITALAVKCQP